MNKAIKLNVFYLKCALITFSNLKITKNALWLKFKKSSNFGQAINVIKKFKKMTTNNLEQKSLVKPKTVIKLVIDPGTSLLKILYVINDSVVKWFTMMPEYIALTSESAESLPINNNSINSIGLPEDNAWVRLSESDDCHLVGYIAKDYKATTSIKKLKHESLIYKVLAVVGAIALREKLPKNFKLELGILLPLSEYRLEVNWKNKLFEALSNFYFQDRLLKVKLSFFVYKPEGYGYTLYTHSQNDADYFHNGNTAIIMMGYRNTSCLFSHRGTHSQEHSQTTDLGFYTLLDKVIKIIPGLSRDDLIKALSTETKESWSKPQNKKSCLIYDEVSTAIDFARLTKSKDPNEAELEKTKIERAYNNSLVEYWRLLSDWLDEILPRQKQVDAILVAGGSSDLLKEQLKKYATDKN
ncbi:MAG: hypothetical protein ACRC1Z_22495, partial [Waterburya sp.]